MADHVLFFKNLILCTMLYLSKDLILCAMLYMSKDLILGMYQIIHVKGPYFGCAILTIHVKVPYFGSVSCFLSRQ